MAIRRGEIYFVNLDPVMGREMGGGKARPVLVLSINSINEKPLVVTVAPGTSAGEKPTHYRNIAVIEPSKRNGLKNRTIFMAHQLRALDQSRFQGPPVGIIEGGDLARVEEAIRFSLGLA